MVKKELSVGGASLKEIAEAFKAMKTMERLIYRAAMAEAEGHQFKPGDLVILKSSPDVEMTVTDSGANGLIEVVWLDEDCKARYIKNIPASCFDLVETDE